MAIPLSPTSTILSSEQSFSTPIPITNSVTPPITNSVTPPVTDTVTPTNHNAVATRPVIPIITSSSLPTGITTQYNTIPLFSTGLITYNDSVQFGSSSKQANLETSEGRIEPVSLDALRKKEIDAAPDQVVVRSISDHVTEMCSHMTSTVSHMTISSNQMTGHGTTDYVYQQEEDEIAHSEWLKEREEKRRLREERDRLEREDEQKKLQEMEKREKVEEESEVEEMSAQQKTPQDNDALNKYIQLVQQQTSQQQQQQQQTSQQQQQTSQQQQQQTSQRQQQQQTSQRQLQQQTSQQQANVELLSDKVCEYAHTYIQ